MAEHNITPIDDELLRARDVAALLDLSLTRTYELLAAGQLPAVKIGRSVRVSRKALEQWIADKSAASLAA